MYVRKDIFILLKLLHFAVNETYCGQVPSKIYKMKPVFDHLIKVFESYVLEDQLPIYESLLLWLEVLYPKEKFSFGMESYKLCKPRTQLRVENIMIH